MATLDELSRTVTSFKTRCRAIGLEPPDLYFADRHYDMIAAEVCKAYGLSRAEIDRRASIGLPMTIVGVRLFRRL